MLVPACESLMGEDRHSLVEDMVVHILITVGVQGNLQGKMDERRHTHTQVYDFNI